MNEWLHRLELSVRLLESKKKPYLARYIGGQIDTLRRIWQGAPYILCTYYFPPELANLFEVEVLYIERAVGLAVGTGVLPESSSLPTGCSYQAAFAALMERELLPRPAQLFSMQFPCADAVKLMEHLHTAYGIPICRISLKNMQRDLLQAAVYLRERYAPRRSVDEVCRFYNRANRCKRQIDELRLRCPGLADSGDMLKLFTVENDFGNEKAVEVLETLLDALRSRREAWEPSSACRILWMGLIPLYDNSLIEKLERRVPIQAVWEDMWMFDHPDCPEPGRRGTEEAFYQQLAGRVQASLFFEPARRQKRLAELAERLHIQLVIYLLQKRCSFLPASIPVFRAAFESRGIPFHVQACDVVRRHNGDLGQERLLELFQAATAAVGDDGRPRVV